MASKPIKYLLKKPTQNKRAAEIAALEAKLLDPDDLYRAADHFGEGEEPFEDKED